MYEARRSVYLGYQCLGVSRGVARDNVPVLFY